MKKIISEHDNKDRIICVSEPGRHEFYYQPVGTGKRYWLFDTKEFSGSIFAYFRSHGRNMDGLGFGLTLAELYGFRNHDNPKLEKLMERIPGHVDYVIREVIVNQDTPCHVVQEPATSAYSIHSADYSDVA